MADPVGIKDAATKGYIGGENSKRDIAITFRYKHTVLKLQCMFQMTNIYRQLRIQVNR